MTGAPALAGKYVSGGSAAAPPFWIKNIQSTERARGSRARPAQAHRDPASHSAAGLDEGGVVPLHGTDQFLSG